jgi:methylmalonyl-CoA mutase N-terminal domain/subunit
MESKSEKKMKFHQYDTTIMNRQVGRLNQVRLERDNNAVEKALKVLQDEAKGRANLMPCLIETVKTYATLGEIMEALKGVFGTFNEPKLI